MHVASWLCYSPHLTSLHTTKRTPHLIPHTSTHHISPHTSTDLAPLHHLPLPTQPYLNHRTSKVHSPNHVTYDRTKLHCTYIFKWNFGQRQFSSKISRHVWCQRTLESLVLACIGNRRVKGDVRSPNCYCDTAGQIFDGVACSNRGND